MSPSHLTIRPLAVSVIVALIFATTAVVAPTPARASGLTRQVFSAGQTQFRTTGAGSGDYASPELAEGPDAAATASAPMSALGPNRSDERKKGEDHQDGSGVPQVDATPILAANAGLKVSIDGLNHRQQRTANGGNQFSLEPPDQGLCVGNGFVLETVNDVLRVFRTDGAPAGGVMDLNTFYGYPAAINRSTGARGPFVTDPSCLFDPTTKRFFHVVLSLEVKPTAPSAGSFTGANHLDLAVSNTSDPTGAWTIYRLPAQDDGTEGTPDHHCFRQPKPPAHRTNPAACLGDFPHIGVDARGFYITTNEYEFFGDAFIGAQIYAFSKARLASGAASVAVTHIDTSHSAPNGKPGFTVWPAQASIGQFDLRNGGTQFALSSTAADEAQCNSGVVCVGSGTSDNILLWALTGTASLDSATPSLTLSNASLEVGRYSMPPRSEQKTGDFPLGQCINDTTLATPFGPGCWQILFNPPAPAHDEVISHLDSSDTRMMQVTLAAGRVWGALDTAVLVNGKTKAGVEWFAVQPRFNDGKLRGEVTEEGYLAVARNNVIYPALAVLPNGKGIMALTLVGQDYNPTAAYVSLSADEGTGPVRIAAPGRGPSDGFTGYKAFVGDPPRTRWGDYGAAAVDGTTIWIASEYINQTCTLAQFTAGVTPTSLGSFGSCGGTRTSLANWGTRISAVVP
jgi:hypothetical protein